MSFGNQEQASFDVDALVNDNETDSMRHTPMTPLGAHFLEQTRRATPTIPPGFTAPVVPRPIAEDPSSRPGSRPMSRTTSATITPAVPIVPVTPIKTNTPSRAKKGKQTADTTPTATIPTKSQPETPTRGSTNKVTAKPDAKSDVQADQKADITARKDLKENTDGKPSLNEPLLKTPGKGKAVTAKNVPLSESSPQRKGSKSSSAAAKKGDSDDSTRAATSTKRQPPSKLDITAATKGPETEQSPGIASQKDENQPKISQGRPTPSTPSVPPSPAVAGTGSPIKRSVAPRTLRVVPTPKTENPPAVTSTTTQPLPQVPTVDKLRSRQASVASVNMPGTPLSEMISDTASVTSASYSRANSPPPVGGKVGTAPVRKKTKSQAKKDRQERKRQIEEEMAVEDNKSDIEVVQAPILGRKKKTKKPSANPKPAPVAKSQPASPKPAAVEDDPSDTPPSASKPDQSAKTSARATPDPDPTQESKDKREHSAQSILADLQRSGELITSTLEFFKPLSSSLTHPSKTSAGNPLTAPPDLKIHFSEADLDALAKKQPVRVQGQDGKPDSRTLITPSGKFFWGLTPELEEKALELEKRIEEVNSHARFHPRKPTSTSKGQIKDVLPTIATALKEADKKLGHDSTHQIPRIGSDPSTADEVQHQPPSLAMQQQQTPADAGAYLNQFVLPRVETPPANQPRPEMAAVGGPPGAGTANISVNSGKFAKAAKAVVEGGAVGSTEIDGMGLMAADLLGGVFVQGLEALVGAGLGPEFMGKGAGGPFGKIAGLDVQSLVSAFEGAANGAGADRNGSGRVRGNVISLEEAEKALQAARKEHDVLEKKLGVLMKKNRKVFVGAAGGKA